MPGAQAQQRTNRNAAERKEKLIQIAFDEIATKGFEGLRFQEVAAKAGITNATLYYYFSSKELLVQAMVDSLMERLKSAGESNARPEANGLHQLRRYFDDLRERVRDPKFFIVITELALRARRDAAIDKIGKRRDGSWERRLREIIVRGVADGSFRKDVDIDAAVLALMVQTKGIGHHAALARRKPGELEQAISEIAAQIENWLVGVTHQ